MYNYYSFEFDANGDGFNDSYAEYTDTDGDGQIDTVVMLSDTDGDGYAETALQGHDSTGSGQFDTIVTMKDTDGDGQADVVQKSHDYNLDGQVDSVTTHTDSDHDGRFDRVTKEYDSTGDGRFDTVDVYFDPTGTGQNAYHGAYTLDPATGLLTPAAADTMDVCGTTAVELDNFQPSDDYPEGISGNPAEAMTYWESQGDTNRCALYSQKFVIEQLSPEGTEIDIEEFANVAKEHGWFTEEGGTTLLNMNNMLDYYGIENEMTFHNKTADIEECLNQGGKVIVSIDANEIWYGEDNNIFAPESSSNHAVEVIGIDRTDPDHPMVILNDSGNPNGCGEMVPLDVFEGAWEDGDCQMITCYPDNN